MCLFGVIKLKFNIKLLFIPKTVKFWPKTYTIRAVLTGRLTVSGFDLAWFSSLSSKRLCVFGLNDAIIDTVFLLTSFFLPFSELEPGGIGP